MKERRESIQNEERHDLLSSLLDANEGVLESDAKLTDDELFGVCCFVYTVPYSPH